MGVGCIHDMIKYLCDKNGVPYELLKKYDSVADALKVCKSNNIDVFKDGKKYCYLNKRHIKGGKLVLEAKKGDFWGEKVIFDFDTKWDAVIGKHKVHLNYFGNFKPIGKYKDSLGGGWYSMVDLYEIDGRQFANMECNCF